MSPEGSSPGRRLDSWKEIAGHFGRDVRTVQRWEERERLPVHRHQHDTQVSVYAYTGELDAWLARRRPVTDETPANRPIPTESEPVSKPWYASRKAVFGASVAAILAISGAVWLRGLTAGARLGFHARDWVLLTGFENRTGDPIFDGTLQYALERELSNSQFVSVIPRERANDALRLMRKPLDVKIDVTTAREICLRDGGIKAVVTGRAEKYGSTYVFSIEVVKPSDGRTLASAEEQAAGQEQVWPAVRKLSNWVRLSLGERLASIEQGSGQLQPVTTPSFRALQLYTQAEAAGQANQWGASEQLARQALAADPEFASGWIWLAWCLHNQRKEAAEYQAAAGKALQFSPRASERERLFILGSSHQFAYRNKGAVEAYSALARLYPDDFWGRRNLIYVCSPEEGPGLMKMYADLRPNDFAANQEAATALAGAGNFSEAQLYWNKARALTTPETGRMFAGEDTEFRLFPVRIAWLKDDARSGLEELSRFGQAFQSKEPTDRELLATYAGLGYLSFGQVRTAEEWFQKIQNEALSHNLLALAAYAGGDETQSRDHATRFFLHPDGARRTGYSSGVALARVGSVLEPKQFISHYERFVEDIFVVHMKGELALSQGRLDDAIRLLREATDDFQQGGNQEFLISSDALALALERRGDPAEALRVLQQASPARSLEIAWNAPTGVFWLRIQAHLAQLYRQTGRTGDARKIEDQLRRLLAYADPDFPVLQQLKHSI